MRSARLLLAIYLLAGVLPAQEESAGVYRVGGGVTAPVPIHRTAPDYTKEARKKKIEGTVVLDFEVDATGHTQNIKVTRSLEPGLDEKAVKSLRKWTFRPGTKDGEPVTVAVHLEVNFRLL
jgi:periplasmic protein TonB